MLRTAEQLRLQEKAFVPAAQDKGAVRGWIAAAHEKRCDADVESVSTGTRFEASYDAIFSLALVVVNAIGMRHRSVDGHHAYVLEAACAAIGAGDAMFDRIDAVREIRNQKYAGLQRTPADLLDARAALDDFASVVATWLQANHAALLR